MVPDVIVDFATSVERSSIVPAALGGGGSSQRCRRIREQGKARLFPYATLLLYLLAVKFLPNFPLHPRVKYHCIDFKTSLMWASRVSSHVTYSWQRIIVK